MAESTYFKTVGRFSRAVMAVFGKDYLQAPTEQDTAIIMRKMQVEDFSGMLGSIDCMHWGWKDCPFAWQGLYKGHTRVCSVILEAALDHELWIWHAFFGMAGTHNDINMLHRSPVFARLAEGQDPEVNFGVNGHTYNKGYYLADGIYSQWSTVVKTIAAPSSEKQSHFAKCQKACWKDVEQAFEVLKQ
jgi:hypothetical protein